MRMNVRDYGATGNGETLDHMAIQSAIDDCSLQGGGTVYVPAGVYLCGTLHLRSNIVLYLEQGAVIQGADDGELYPEICKTPYGNLPGQIQALLWADGVENVTIAGHGAVDGGGNSALPPAVAAGVTFRPALVFYRDCKNVKFLDVTLRYSCFWTLHLMRCEDVAIRGVTIIAHQGRINTDGIDPDGCRNVVISDCLIKTGDDCIVIKSTEGDPCENLTITNCILSSSHAALKIGTEAIGDIRNITFTNCVIKETNVALALYMKDGSTYENIVFSNMVIEADSEFPLLIDVTPRYYREPRIGHIRSIFFDNIIFTGKGRCYIEGTKEKPIEDLSFHNITWHVTGPCNLDRPIKPPGARRVDIDPNRENYAVHPYQFIAAHVTGLNMSRIRILNRTGADGLDRGAVYVESGKNLNLEHIRAEDPSAENQSIQLRLCE
jgi:hypothetical protein